MKSHPPLAFLHIKMFIILTTVGEGVNFIFSINLGCSWVQRHANLLLHSRTGANVIKLFTAVIYEFS